MGKLPPEVAVAKYDALVATIPGLERKGKKFLYTSVNGRMYTYLANDGQFGIRLSKEDQAKFAEEYDIKPLKQYGATLREYVLITEELVKDTEKLAPFLKMSHEYFTSLPPKK